MALRCDPAKKRYEVDCLVFWLSDRAPWSLRPYPLWRSRTPQVARALAEGLIRRAPTIIGFDVTPAGDRRVARLESSMRRAG